MQKHLKIVLWILFIPCVFQKFETTKGEESPVLTHIKRYMGIYINNKTHRENPKDPFHQNPKASMGLGVPQNVA